MTRLAEIVGFLERELSTSSIPDYPAAMNGLQLENSGRIERIVAAVDASLPVIKAVAAGPPGLLIVHHGLFWQGAQRLTGPVLRKWKTAIDADLAIYSSHIPLDVHPLWGNNAGLAEAIGLADPLPFFDFKGISLGLRGIWSGSREDLVTRLRDLLQSPVHLCPGGDRQVASVGIITGGAGSEIAKVAAEGVSTFITGEGPHWSYPLAEELGVNLIYAGHYATETIGVKLLAAELSRRFQLPWEFHDHPTGL